MKRRREHTDTDGVKLYPIAEARQIMGLGEKTFRRKMRDEADPLRNYVISMGPRLNFMRLEDIKAYLAYLASRANA
jgi:hypothetical protein